MSIPANKKLKSSKGFTLIELLVVLVILATLVSGVWIAINPLNRINQAKDAKVKSDVGQIASAEMAYFTLNQEYGTIGEVVTDSGLKQTPTGITISPADPTSSTTNIAVCGPLLAPKVAANVFWVWKSETGIADEAASCTP